MSRHDDAIRAALQVAHEWGLPVEEPLPLRSTNNVVAWLRPSGVVAKVGVQRHERLRTELEVALELSVLDAPVVSPATELPAVVHSRDGFDITFWRYHPQPPQADVAVSRKREALARLHAALARISPSLRHRLPSYMRDLDAARAHLESPGLPALSPDDRQLLADTFERLKGELQTLVPSEAHVALHGSPHSYNVLLVAGAPRFIDFENACMGPVEWDLAYVDEPPGDDSTSARLHRACSDMASVATAVWCWAAAERGDLRIHAQLHLDRIRKLAASFPNRGRTGDPSEERR
jgi:hypothetical protein